MKPVTLDGLHVEVSNMLADLERWFKPGMRLTFVARHPDHTERHVIVTNDDLTGLADLMRRESEKEKK